MLLRRFYGVDSGRISTGHAAALATRANEKSVAKVCFALELKKLGEPALQGRRLIFIEFTILDF